MKINKAIRLAMKTDGVSLSDMGKLLIKTDRKTGEKKALSGNDVSARLNSDNLSFDKAVEMLLALDCEIIIRRKAESDKSNFQVAVDQKG